LFEKLHILAVTNTYITAAIPGDSPQIKDLVEALKAKGVMAVADQVIQVYDQVLGWRRRSPQGAT
jgi:hypothetical protein